MFIALATVVATSGAAAQMITYVDADAPPGGDGASWATAYNDLQDALPPLAGATEIWIAEGVYKPSERDVTATFQMRSRLAVYGGFRGDETARDQRDPALYRTVLSGDLLGNDGPGFTERWDNVLHVVSFRLTDDSAILDGVTITGGQADGVTDTEQKGGGIAIAGASPIIRDCVIQDCHADREGGGIHVVSGDPLLERIVIQRCEVSLSTTPDERGGGLFLEDSSALVRECAFLDNSTPGWGAGVTLLDSSAVLEGCLFERNDAWRGGGLHLITSPATVRACTFTGNEAVEGGAMFCLMSAPRVDDSHFELNRAREGSALYCQDSEGPMFTGCTWSRNGTDDTGQPLTDRNGAIRVYHSRMQLRDCAFISNRAYGSGAAVSVNVGVLTCDNCRFEDNAASSGGAASVEAGELFLTRCDLIGNWAFSSGGAIAAAAVATVDIHNSTLRANWAGESGGAIAAHFVRISNSALFSNEARLFDGGAIVALDSLEVSGSTIALNRAANLGGGVRRAITALPGHTLILANTVLWGNTSIEPGPEERQLSLRDFSPENLRVSFSILEGWSGGFPGEQSFGDDPLLVDPLGPDGTPLTGDESVRLGAGSPGRDRGANDLIGLDWADLDGDGDVTEPAPFALDGGDRRVDDPAVPDTGRGMAPLVDIGAYEASPAMCRADLTGDGILDLFDFLEFQNLFGAGDPRADFTGDGVLDLFDFLAFQNEFGRGCG
ncbi:MAG: right-handed parallel beta-helix repeat-containing protein [Phycisphaerales bacterium JB039]